METYTGKSILKGIAIGRILFYSKEEQVVQRRSVQDVDAEKGRYEQAKETAVRQLNELYEKALKEVGEVNAAIFEVHAMMLEDEDFNDSILNMIEGQKVVKVFCHEEESIEKPQVITSLRCSLRWRTSIFRPAPRISRISRNGW